MDLISSRNSGCKALVRIIQSKSYWYNNFFPSENEISMGDIDLLVKLKV